MVSSLPFITTGLHWFQNTEVNMAIQSSLHTELLFLAAVMRQNIREINAETYSTSWQIRIRLRSTLTSPKPKHYLPRSHTANRSQRSCLATWVLLPAVSGKKWTLSAESGISTSLNDRNKLLLVPSCLVFQNSTYCPHAFRTYTSKCLT